MVKYNVDPRGSSGDRAVLIGRHLAPAYLKNPRAPISAVHACSFVDSRFKNSAALNFIKFSTKAFHHYCFIDTFAYPKTQTRIQERFDDVQNKQMTGLETNEQMRGDRKVRAA